MPWSPVKKNKLLVEAGNVTKMSALRKSKSKILLSEEELNEIKKYERKDTSLACSIRKRSRRSIVKSLRGTQEPEEISKHKRRSSISSRTLVPTFTDHDTSNEKIRDLSFTKEEQQREEMPPKAEPLPVTSTQLTEEQPKEPADPEPVTQTTSTQLKELQPKEPADPRPVTQTTAQEEANTEENSSFQEYEQYVKEVAARCLKERNEWQQLFQNYKDMNAEDNSDDVPDSTEDIVNSLSQEEKDLLEGRLQYTKMANDAKEMVEDLKTKAINIHSALTLCNEFKETSKKYIQKQIANLESKTMAETGALRTPRTLIRSLQDADQ